MRGDLQDRFEAKTIPPSKPDGCVLWGASKRTRGLPYGMIGVEVAPGVWKIRATHRVSWELYCGPIPKGMNVLHRCDNASCVNPDHLFLGTQKENVLDMNKKGRGPSRAGERNGKAKLTAEQVASIRADQRSQTKIAADYGVAHTLIGKIKHRKLWAHV